MINKLINILALFLITTIAINYSSASEQFKFDVTEIEITQNGNFMSIILTIMV